MRSQPEQKNPIHLAIYVYDEMPPPEGTPRAVSLCPRGHRDTGERTDIPAMVTCWRCRDHMDNLGISST